MYHVINRKAISRSLARSLSRSLSLLSLSLSLSRSLSLSLSLSSLLYLCDKPLVADTVDVQRVCVYITVSMSADSRACQQLVKHVSS